MGVLNRTRWEKVAQFLSEGKSAKEACVEAGYKPHNKAADIVGKPEIQARLYELQLELSERLMKSKEELLMELGKIIEKTGKGTDGNKIKAIKLIAEMTGMLQNTLNVNMNKTAEEMSDDELVLFLKKDIEDEEKTA